MEEFQFRLFEAVNSSEAVNHRLESEVCCKSLSFGRASTFLLRFRSGDISHNAVLLYLLVRQLLWEKEEEAPVGWGRCVFSELRKISHHQQPAEDEAQLTLEL